MNQLNLSFSIDIDKAARRLELTPEEAQKKLEGISFSSSELGAMMTLMTGTEISDLKMDTDLNELEAIEMQAKAKTLELVLGI